MTIATKINGALFVALMAIPLVAELVTAKPDDVPGTGFDVLLYQPFDFAYVLLAGALFFVANIKVSAAKDKKLPTDLAKSVVIWLLWFFVSFLAVGQLHISLGGKL